MEATNDMQSLKETCPLAFEGIPAAPSATQQQVGETLRQIELSVKHEARCPKSGYSIDISYTTAPPASESRGAARGVCGQWI